MMQNEECWVIEGTKDGDLWWGDIKNKTIGLPTSVTFDPGYVTKMEEESGCIMGWLHLHPGMTASPSDRDHATMKAWVGSLGKPLACLIDGIDGLKAWWYMDDESDPEEYQVQQVGDMVFGVTPELYFSALDILDEQILYWDRKEASEMKTSDSEEESTDAK